VFIGLPPFVFQVSASNRAPSHKQFGTAIRCDYLHQITKPRASFGLRLSACLM
jgi:hypothetical protein